MKFGIAATTSVTPAVTGPAQADYVRRMVQTAEECGYDSVWVSDRTVYPRDLAERYPEQFGPGKADPESENVLEAVSTLSYIAGVTSRVRVGMSVLVLPFRHPVLNAKMLTTLDVLSGGRLIVGVGTGGMPEEFAAMGAEFSDRGRDTDEHIEAFKTLCRGGDYSGRLGDSTGMRLFPEPVQKPHPPIWIGGNSGAAQRRAARLGDGWHPNRLTPDEVSAGRSALDDLCREQGREPADVSLSLRATLVLGRSQQDATGSRMPLTGSEGEIRDDLRRYEDAGLDYLVLSIDEPTENATANTAMEFAVLAGLQP